MNKLLLLIVIVLGILAIAQVVRVYELTARLRSKREEEVSRRDNKLNATLMLIFMLALYASFIYLMFKYGDGGLGTSASEHGVAIDTLLDFNFLMIIIVFFITNTLLFWFSFKYYYSPDRKAFYYPHNNKLELIWTIIPAAFLAVIIIYGLRTWNEITSDDKGDEIIIELYAKQFDWTIRYSGDDNTLGFADYKMIYGKNELGLITTQTLNEKIVDLDEQISVLEADIEQNGIYTPNKKLSKKIKQLEVLRRQKERILTGIMNGRDAEKQDLAAFDDMITKGELHLVVGQPYSFRFRSQDIIHSAYFPHFRAQMNCVPGMVTKFKFTPTITTDSMRAIKGDESFDYILLCNKICGSAHYNMKIKVIVETQEEFNAWKTSLKTFNQMISPIEETQEGLIESDKAQEEEESTEGTEQ
ncbi:MAG: cytochrome c oxidase subunit II transmembrane domain-containing protein [Flavobacteriales bacterium]